MVQETIRSRKSTVLFSEKEIEQDKLKSLFEAARWAPSSYNQQPWHFIFGQKGNKAYDGLYECLMDGNKNWANKAPVLILSAAAERMAYNRKENVYAWHDTGTALGFLALQAEYIGLSTHPMGGFDRIKARSVTELPEDVMPVAMIAVGYKDPDQSHFETELVNRELQPRTRKTLDQLVSMGKYGKVAFK